LCVKIRGTDLFCSSDYGKIKNFEQEFDFICQWLMDFGRGTLDDWKSPVRIITV